MLFWPQNLSDNLTYSTLKRAKGESIGFNAISLKTREKAQIIADCWRVSRPFCTGLFVAREGQSFFISSHQNVTKPLAVSLAPSVPSCTLIEGITWLRRDMTRLIFNILLSLWTPWWNLLGLFARFWLSSCKDSWANAFRSKARNRFKTWWKTETETSK